MDVVWLGPFLSADAICCSSLWSPFHSPVYHPRCLLLINCPFFPWWLSQVSNPSDGKHGMMEGCREIHHALEPLLHFRAFPVAAEHDKISEKASLPQCPFQPFSALEPNFVHFGTTCSNVRGLYGMNLFLIAPLLGLWSLNHPSLRESCQLFHYFQRKHYTL